MLWESAGADNSPHARFVLSTLSVQLFHEGVSHCPVVLRVMASCKITQHFACLVQKSLFIHTTVFVITPHLLQVWSWCEWKVPLFEQLSPNPIIVTACDSRPREPHRQANRLLLLLNNGPLIIGVFDVAELGIVNTTLSSSGCWGSARRNGCWRLCHCCTGGWM